MISRVKELYNPVTEKETNEGSVELVQEMEKLSRQVLDNASRVNEASGKQVNFAEDVLALSTHTAEELREVEWLVDKVSISVSEVANRFVDSMDHLQKLFNEILDTQSLEKANFVSQKVSAMTDNAKATVSGSHDNMEVGHSLIDSVESLKKWLH